MCVDFELGFSVKGIASLEESSKTATYHILNQAFHIILKFCTFVTEFFHVNHEIYIHGKGQNYQSKARNNQKLD